MAIEEGDNENFSEVSDIKLIDFSTEDDFLVDHPFRGSLEDLRLSVSFRDISEHAKSFTMVNQWKAANRKSIQHLREQNISTSGPLEPRRESPSQKRIDWDNAFCSNAGVLEPEVLSAMDEGFKKKPESFIPEDLKMNRSAESDFTFESFDGDAFSLECLENDLFNDVRASIYRSCGTPIFSPASCDSVTGKSVTSNSISSKKVVSSQNMRNSSANSRRQSPTIKKSKAMTTSSLHSQNLQHIKGGCDATPTGQTKKALLGSANVKNRKTGQGLMVHKLSASMDSPGLNLSTPPTKSSYRISRTATKSPSFAGSSCDQFSSTSSSRSLLSCGTRKTGSNSSKIASSGSNSKPPLGYSGRSRLSNQTSSIHLLSMPHHSNSSPASSIGRWSSQSYSSSFRATAKLRSGNLEGKLKTESNQASGLHQFTPTKMSPDQHSKGEPKEVSPVPVETPISSKPSGFDQHSEGASKELSPAPVETPKSFKPSKLRMPSPKLGFFDEEKPLVRSTLDIMQFQFRSPNALSDLSASPIKRRNVPETRNKISYPLTQSLHRTSSTRPQHSMSMHSKAVDIISTRSAGIKNSLKTEEKINKGILKNKIGKKGKDQEAQNGILPDTMKPVKKDHEASRELLLESNGQSHSPGKENFEDQVKDLSRYFEVIDLAKELDGQKSNAREHDKSLDGVHFFCGQQQDSPSITRIPFAEEI